MENFQFFYIKEPNYCVGSTQEVWRPASSPGEAAEAEEFIYAEDYDTLRAALEERYPHPHPNFSHVEIDVYRRHLYRACVDPEISYPKFPVDGPRISYEQFLQLVVEVAKMHPGLYTTYGEPEYQGHYCSGIDNEYIGDADKKKSLLLKHGLVTDRSGYLKLGDKRQLSSVKSRLNKKAWEEAEKRSKRQKEQEAQSLPTRNIRECTKYFLGCLGFDKIDFTIYGSSTLADQITEANFFASLTLINTVTRKNSYRKHEPFQKFLSVWRSRNEISREKTKEAYPDLYAFLELEAAIKAPRKLFRKEKEAEDVD